MNIGRRGSLAQRTPISIMVLLVAFALIMFSGCASTNTKEMALTPGGDAPDLASGSICLLSIHTDNQFKPDWPPEVWGLEITNQATKQKINIAVQSMSLGSLIQKGVSDAFTYDKGTSSWAGLISFQLKPGNYRLTAVRGGCNRGVGVAAAMASFDFPFDMPFQVKPGEVVYLGRINMINRERTSPDEVLSGNDVASRKPQFDSGFGNGTFDVTVEDKYNSDIAQFKKKYSSLAGLQITKSILPAWHKPVAN